jgi:hypothetical protein
MRKGAIPSKLQQKELGTFVEQRARTVSIFAVVVVESRIRIIYWGRGKSGGDYVPYFLSFSNFLKLNNVIMRGCKWMKL